MKYSMDVSTELVVLRDLTKDARPGVMTVVGSNIFKRRKILNQGNILVEKNQQSVVQSNLELYCIFYAM